MRKFKTPQRGPRPHLKEDQGPAEGKKKFGRLPCHLLLKVDFSGVNTLHLVGKSYLTSKSMGILDRKGTTCQDTKGGLKGKKKEGKSSREAKEEWLGF